MRFEESIMPKAVSDEIPAVPLTIEGYSVLHQMMRVRWAAWRQLAAADKGAVVDEAAGVLAGMEQNSGGPSALFSLLGHKADLCVLALGPDLWRLRALQTDLQRAGLDVVDSYVSLTEVSEYADGVPDEIKSPGNSVMFCEM